MLTKGQRWWIDTAAFMTFFVISAVWMVSGETKAAVILAAVNYWGCPWANDR